MRERPTFSNDGLLVSGAGQEEEIAVVRTENTPIFSYGSERGSIAAWPDF